MVLRMIPLLLLAFACGGKSAPAPTSAPSKVLVLVDEQGVGLGGHDPVAYATDNAAVAGAPEHSSQHGGATYRFASAKHKATFEVAPATHAPQYGGYCAYAASMNRLSESDPKVFQIVDGQLLVFTNEDFKQQFNKDVAGNKAKADANWPGLVAKHGK
jgi:YHS domain-containing protein